MVKLTPNTKKGTVKPTAVKKSKGAPGRTTKQRGDIGEERALAFLRNQGLHLLVRNYRTPGRGGGEIDLIMRSPDQTVVFIEVRCRVSDLYGGAGASINATKRRRIVRAAQYFLCRLRYIPACRFDVVLIGPAGVQWLVAAFDAAG
jgi:putative endonuclease